MAVTLRDGTRFSITREPLGFTMDAVRAHDDDVRSMRAYIDLAELEHARDTPLVVWRWYRVLVLEHMRTFGGQSVLRKAGKWSHVP